MPEFISKLQYKTCEHGEYYEEKARTLDETIHLINNFPWAREQYAQLGVTGPSITIRDPHGNYLKVGIYYGGKYSLYYLDAKKTYYERRNLRMDIVYNCVKALFAGNVNLQEFSNPKWSTVQYLINRDFLTKTFEYLLRFWEIVLMSIFWLIYFIFFLIVSMIFILEKPFEPFTLILLICPLLIGFPIYHIFSRLYPKREQYIKIARGTDSFLFGDKADEVKSYNKNDIEKVVHYIDNSSRSPNMFELLEIIFKDGSSIKFSNALISDITLRSKFSDKWHLQIENKRMNVFRLMKSLC